MILLIIVNYIFVVLRKPSGVQASFRYKDSTTFKSLGKLKKKKKINMLDYVTALIFTFSHLHFVHIHLYFILFILELSLLLLAFRYKKKKRREVYIYLLLFKKKNPEVLIGPNTHVYIIFIVLIKAYS